MPIRAPKFSPISRERDGIEGAEDEADERLAADEAGDRPVDLAGERADGVAVRARHPGVDRADHPVPVDQHVEGDDRRHDEKREHADERLPAGPQAAQERRRSRPRPADEVADRALHVGERLGPPSRSMQRPPCSTTSACRRVDIVRQPSTKLGELVRQQRHEQHQRERRTTSTNRTRIRSVAPSRPRPEPLSRSASGIEHIGEREPGHERQQDAAQDVEQQRRRRRAPRARTPTCRWSVIVSSRSARPPSGRHVPQPAAR